jgi:hypothetical protein
MGPDPTAPSPSAIVSAALNHATSWYETEKATEETAPSRTVALGGG